MVGKHAVKVQAQSESSRLEQDTLSGTFCMILCLLVWQGGSKINFAESLIIFPGGFSVGLVSSTTFVALAAGVAHEEVAIAGSGMYTFANIGAIAGVSAGSAIYQSALYAGLKNALVNVETRSSSSLLIAKR